MIRKLKEALASQRERTKINIQCLKLYEKFAKSILNSFSLIVVEYKFNTKKKVYTGTAEVVQ